MEKIKERNFKWLWGPIAIFFVALLCAGLCLLFNNLFGVILAFIFGLTAVVALVALFVYFAYFYYQLSLDVNAVCEGDGVETKSYLFVLALSAVTFGFYQYYWIYKVGQRLQANAPRYGFKMIIGGKEFLVLHLFSMGWISAWEFVRNMNRFAKVYNKTGLAEVVGGVQ